MRRAERVCVLVAVWLFACVPDIVHGTPSQLPAWVAHRHYFGQG